MTAQSPTPEQQSAVLTWTHACEELQDRIERVTDLLIGFDHDEAVKKLSDVELSLAQVRIRGVKMRRAFEPPPQHPNAA
jgi:hypothetical protein